MTEVGVLAGVFLGSVLAGKHAGMRAFPFENVRLQAQVNSRNDDWSVCQFEAVSSVLNL